MYIVKAIGKLDFFLIHQILWMHVGGHFSLFISYTVICLKTFKKFIKKLDETCKSRVEPMQVGMRNKESSLLGLNNIIFRYDYVCA